MAKTEEENIEAVMDLAERFVSAIELLACAAADGKLAPIVNVAVVNSDDDSTIRQDNAER